MTRARLFDESGVTLARRWQCRRIRFWKDLVGLAGVAEADDGRGPTGLFKLSTSQTILEEIRAKYLGTERAEQTRWEGRLQEGPWQSWQGAQGHSEQGGGVAGHLCSQPVLNPCKFKITIAPCGKPLVTGALEPRPTKSGLAGLR